MNVAVPPKPGLKYGNKASVSYEIAHNLPDKNGVSYPPKDKAYTTVSKTANSSGLLTNVYIKKVLFPAAGVKTTLMGYEFQRRIGALCDDFSGHKDEKVKNFTTSPSIRNNLGWIIIDGGLTPTNQPLDKTVNRVFKGHLRDLYDQWSLTCPVNPNNGAPYPPTRQLCARWVVEAWDKIPEELCRNAWTHCGYKSKSELGTGSEMVRHTAQETSLMVQRIIGDDAAIGIDDAEITDPMDPHSDDEDDEVEEVYAQATV